MQKKLVIALLAGILVLSGLFFGLNNAQSEEKLAYVGAAKCKMCHNLAKTGKYFDDWQSKKHYKSFFNLKGGEQKDPKCLKCHTTGFGEPGGFDPKNFTIPFTKVEDMKSSKEETEYMKAMLGVQCEVCHGPGEKHIKSKRGQEVIPHAWEPSEAVCVKCHNDQNPHWNPEKYTTQDGKKTGFDYEQAVKIIAHKVEKSE